MYKRLLFIVFTALLSCSDTPERYPQNYCQVEIKEGAKFTLCGKFREHNPIEDLSFNQDVILSGMRYDDPDRNRYLYRIENINKTFTENNIKFDDLNFVFINDSINWVDNGSSNANFCFDSIDYYAINESICHFKCYGKKTNYLFGYSGYDTTILINAEFKFKLINH